MHEHAPAGLFLPCTVQKQEAVETERKKMSTNPHATFRQCSTFGGSCETFFFFTGASRIVSKELQVILKVTINFFLGSKWIQSLKHVRLLPEDVVQVHLFHFKLCWVVKRYVTIVSG